MRRTYTAKTVLNAGQLEINAWLNFIKEKVPEKFIDTIRHAVIFAELAGANQACPNGISCLHQGLIIADILSELEVDETTLASAIIYPSTQYAGLTHEDIQEKLGENVAKLIQASEKMQAVHNLHEKLSEQTHLSATIDNLRKMLLAMVTDMRVILIKLAEQICVMRNCKLFTDAKRTKLAIETRDIYAPLANRLGIGHLKWQLEDLAFRELDRTKYAEISKLLNSTRIERENYVNRFIDHLESALIEMNIKSAEVAGRVKHIYSIYRKMQRKNVDIHEIYDVTAVRILVPSIEDCYQALSYVQSQWPTIPKEFDDYIAQPKSNGYRSIHTAVIGPENKAVEIQIRTFDMHQESELGVAAHWKYKEGNQLTASDYEAKIVLLRQLMDWQKEVTQDERQAEDIQNQIFDDRVYAFTPTGDIFDLEKGATPLDFAYHIHTEIGNRCRGAKVNNQLVPLTYQLKTGDQVSILTAKNGQPSRDWLNPYQGYLHTARAKAKVHNWFRKLDYADNITLGQNILDRELKKLALKKLDQKALTEKLHYTDWNDVVAALGRGDIRINTILNNLQQLNKPEKPEAFALKIKTPKKIPSIKDDFSINGVGNLLTRMAECCKPSPSDDISGYVTLGKGISIHRKDCSNLLYSIKIHPERQIDVSWQNKNSVKQIESNDLSD